MATTYGYDSKPMIIGEFPASGWSGDTYVSSMAAKTEISTEECYRKAFDGGYAGALAWQYIGDKTEEQFGGYSYTIDPALAAMKALAATEEASIKIKDVDIEDATGNGMMAVTYGDDNAQIEYQKSFDLGSANTLSFVAKNNGSSEAKLYLILKLTDAWTWTEIDGECTVAAGEKKTCSYDISSFADRNQTRSIIIANYAAGYKGTILYDDVVAGDTLFNFNTDKYDAFSRSFGNTEAMIPEIKIVFNNEDYIAGISPRITFARTSMHFSGNTLQLSVAQSGNISVGIYTLKGSQVATLHRGILTAGTHQFDLSKISQGVYLVRVKGKNFNAHRTIQIK